MEHTFNIGLDLSRDLNELGGATGESRSWLGRSAIGSYLSSKSSDYIDNFDSCEACGDLEGEPEADWNPETLDIQDTLDGLGEALRQVAADRAAGKSLAPDWTHHIKFTIPDTLKVDLPDDMAANLKSYSDSQGQALDSVVRAALKDYLDSLLPEVRDVLKGSAQLDGGQGIPIENVIEHFRAKSEQGRLDDENDTSSADKLRPRRTRMHG